MMARSAPTSEAQHSEHGGAFLVHDHVRVVRRTGRAVSCRVRRVASCVDLFYW